MSLRVLLADADPLQRDGWRMVLDAQPDVRVVAEAPDGLLALAVLRREPVDVAVLDVRMPRMSGLQVAALVRDDARIRIAQRGGSTRVVLVTATDLDRYVPEALAVAAQTVLYKDVRPEAFLAAVRDSAA